MNILKNLGIILTAGMLATSFAYAGTVKEYPNKPIRLIVPYSAGGITDVLGRMYAKQLSEQLGQPVITENRTGAAGSIGIDQLVRSEPDGYTLAFSPSGPLASNFALYKELSYHPVEDLAPVARIGFIQNIMVIHPDVPAKNFDEMIKLLRDNPGKYSYASGGNGTAQHFSGELLKSLAKVDMTHVPYRGESQSINDVLGGQVPISFLTASVALPHIESGRLRAIAVTSKVRSARLPDVPTIAESGFPEYEMVAWFGAVVPKGTPQAIQEKLNEASAKAFSEGPVHDRFEAIDGIPGHEPLPELRDFIKSEVAKWSRIVELTGARLD